ncbi:glycosyltransferase [Sphingomonas sp. TREG-RG-20F-R18-01]|uniref:glycosyltransferase n=1 Tax=Sphingomonas sp. TREG-RG-20F-R18-01 TaxID=2914982 RepID=UPI001F593E22
MRIAYLVNKYPAVSHSFIRREIAAVEEAGSFVLRFSIRAAPGALPDAKDRAELDLTRVVLANGFAPLALDTVRVAAANPSRFLRAVRLVGRAIADDPKRGWKHFAYLAEACWLARRLDGAQHVHAHFGTNPAAVARLVHHLTGLPYSFTVHGPDEFDSPRGLDLSGKIADAQQVMAISSYGRSQLMRWSSPADWHKISVVRCGVDQLFTEEPPQADRSPPILCAVARLSAQKGLPLLLEAAARLKAQGRTFRLVLVGDGEMRDEIEALIQRRGLSETVTITGFVDAGRVREILLTSRAMVLPSFAEGLPVVIMEALALRTPVIASAIAGTPELVDSTCGWLIPAGSIDALVTAMEQALDATPGTLHAMGAIGRGRVLEQHDSARNGAQLAAQFAGAA